MNKLLSDFLKTSFIFFVGNVFTKLITFLLLPLYTSQILPSDYGVFGLVQSLSNIIIPVIFCQIWDGVFRFSFDCENEDGKYVYINNGIVFFSVSTIFVIIGFSIFNQFYNVTNALLIAIFSLQIAFQYLFGMAARSFKKNKLFMVSGVVNSLVTLSVNYFCIIKLNIKLESLYLAPIIGTVCQILIINNSLKFKKNFKKSDINITLIKTMLKFSIPLSLTTVIYWLLSGYTQVYIFNILGSYSNGIYNVATKFSAILILVFSIFQFAWTELTYQLSSSLSKNVIYEKGINLVFQVSVLGTGISILFIKSIFPYLIDNKYISAQGLIPLLIIGAAANSLTSFINSFFLANKKSNKLILSTLIGGGLNVISIPVLTKTYGLQGALFSLTISFLLILLIRLIQIYREEGIKIYSKNYLLLIHLVISVFIYVSFSVNIIYYLIFIGMFLSALVILINEVNNLIKKNK